MITNERIVSEVLINQQNVINNPRKVQKKYHWIQYKKIQHYVVTSDRNKIIRPIEASEISIKYFVHRLSLMEPEDCIKCCWIYHKKNTDKFLEHWLSDWLRYLNVDWLVLVRELPRANKCASVIFNKVDCSYRKLASGDWTFLGPISIL